MAELDIVKSQGVIISDNGTDQQGQGIVFEVSKADLEEIKVAMEKCRIAGLDPQEHLKLACLTRNDPHFSVDFQPVPDNLKARLDETGEIIGIMEDVLVCCKKSASLTARLISGDSNNALTLRNRLEVRSDLEDGVEVAIFQTPQTEKLSA